jgi:hypothetical protein
LAVVVHRQCESPLLTQTLKARDLTLSDNHHFSRRH